MNMPEIHILEDTFRDSLYITDFMIEPNILVAFVKRLTDIGFKHIEIGHSLGLGAYRSFASGFSDQELLKKIPELLEKHCLHQFFMPAIGNYEDAKEARKTGLYGIRVGIHADEFQQNRSLLEKLKNLGYHVSVNLMKSYATSADVFCSHLKGISELADVVYLVDSAGTMLPHQVKDYFHCLKAQEGKVTLGFHGHNNLGLALANGLAAIESGATFLDTTLGGIGRSGGNIPTESLIAVLLRTGQLNKDEGFLLSTLEISFDYRNYLQDKGRYFSVNETDILYGYSGFHSSYARQVKAVSEAEGVGYYDLVLELCKRSQREINAEQIQAAIRYLLPEES